MSYSNPFPYSHTIASITPNQGKYANNTFVVAAYSSGISAGQVQPTTQKPPYQYSRKFCGDILNSGSSDTALEFVMNSTKNDKGEVIPISDPPYYFVLGSGAGNVILHQFNPADDLNDFQSSNIIELETIDKSSFSSDVADLLFYPPLNILYVATKDGEIGTYKVSFDNNNKPSFSYQGANKNYAASDGAVSMSLYYGGAKNAQLIVTGLQKDGTNGAFIFPISGDNNGILSDANDVIWYTNNSVAVVTTSKGIYTATATSLIYHVHGQLQTQGETIWTPKNEIIMSLAWSPNPKNCDPETTIDSTTEKTVKQFSQGALFIGTCSNSSEITHKTFGSIHTYDPIANKVTSFQSKTVQGPPYSVYADANLHVLVNCGSTGLDFYSLVFDEDNSMPAAQQVIPNTAFDSSDSSEHHHGILGFLVSYAEIVFGVVTDDPAAIGFGISGMIADTGDAIIDNS